MTCGNSNWKLTLKLNNKLNIIVSTVILAIFLYLAFRNVNLDELVLILKTTNYVPVLIGSLFGVIGGTAIRVLRWRYLLSPIKKDIPFKSLMSSTSIGYMLNNLIPRSGEVVRPYLLGKHEGVSKAAVFGTIIIERIIDTLSFLLMFGFVLIYFKNRITAAIPDIGTAVIILTVFIFLLFFWVIYTMFRTEQSLKLIQFFTRILPLKYRNKIDKIFNSLVIGFHSLRKPDLLIKIAFYSALLWLVYLVSTYIPFFAFDIFTGTESTGLWEGLWNANILLVLVNVAQFIPAPAATGPYHYIVKVSLVSIFAISQAKALGYATSTHLLNFIIYTLVGIYYFAVSNYKISELKEESI